MATNALTRNPNSPLGGRTTSTFEGARTLLDFELSQRRQEILRQLGQTTPTGQRIIGDVELQLGRDVSDLERQRGLAVEDVMNAMRGAGSLFSTHRVRQQARAQHPFIQSIVRRNEDASRTLTDLYRRLADLERERQIRTSMLVAEEASARAARQRSQAFGG